MDLDIRKLQLVILEIAKEIKRICDKNGIKYTMIGGTLIGALRHKGFIPWDDDMDFAMTRDNYERFLKCCATDLKEQFALLNWNNNNKYGYGFSKIYLKGTLLIEAGHENVSYEQGIFVDIFPLDRIPDNLILREIHNLKTYIMLKTLQQYDNIRSSKVGFAKVLFVIPCFLATLVPHDVMVRLCEKNMKKYNNKNTQEFTNIPSSYKYKKEIKSCTLLDEYVEYEFEDTTFMAVKDYDGFLKGMFDNYMQLPPMEKRISHSIVKIDFGKY